MGIPELPEGYRFRSGVDLRKDRRAMLTVGIGQMATMILMGLLGLAVLPGEMVSRGTLFTQVAILCLGILCYGAVHELLRGAVMQQKSGSRSRYLFVGWRWYAVNEAYFTRGSYACILLLPLLLLTVATAGAFLIAANAWKWTMYGLLVVNVAAAWEDGYLAVSLCRIQRNALIRHCGPGLEIYTE